MRAILPAPMDEPFRVDWLYVPCTELAGDSLGYHWIDSDHFALYLLDVCGHGVGAALLSVAAINALRSGALPVTDFLSPGDVLRALNEAFQMEDHNEMYFTIWYGVLHVPSRSLRYASAGHPAPILVDGPRERGGEPMALPGSGPVVGMLPVARYQTEEIRLASPTQLFVFSDGVYEITRPNGEMLEYSRFQEVLTRPFPAETSELDELYRFAQEMQGASVLEDDFSILRLEL